MMILLLGPLTNLDLSVKSEVAEANTFVSWLKLLFSQLDTVKIWPHENAILKNMPKKFKDDYPHHTIIIDCTELKIPSSLVIQSESYSELSKP